MRRKVNLSSFANYPLLLSLLENTENMFHDVEKDARMSSAVSSMRLNLEVAAATNPASIAQSIPSGAESTTPVETASKAQVPSSPHLTPSNSSSTAIRFPASVLWSSHESEQALGNDLLETGSNSD